MFILLLLFYSLSRSLGIHIDDFYQFLRCITINVRISLIFSCEISKYALPKSVCNLKYILMVESMNLNDFKHSILILINILMI